MTLAPLAAVAALGLILRATLLIGAAWAAAAMLRKAGASAAARHMAWLLGISALLALPLVWWLAPPLRLPILGPEEATAAAFAMPVGSTPPVPAGAPGWSLILLAFYLIGAAAVILRFALSRHLVSRLWREAGPARDADWHALLAGVSREIGLSRPVQLRIACGPAMPMTWGTLAPRILLPAEARSWPAERRRLVLLHELAHVARRDSLARSAASLACALYWFHPGAWFAARRMRLEQECAADDRVLNAGAGPRNYARSLLDLALDARETRWPDHAAAMAGMCQLERRVVSITTPARREQPGLPFLSASVAVGTCIMLAVATAIPVRPIAELRDPPGFETAAVTRIPEGLSEQAPDRGTVAARTDDRPQEIREGLATQGAPAPPPQAEGRARETTGRMIEPTAQANAGAPLPGPVIQDASPPPQQFASYGPQLPQPLPAEQESDPRIPAALREGNVGRSAHRTDRPASSRSRAGSILRVLPSVILGSSGVLPAR